MRNKSAIKIPFYYFTILFVSFKGFQGAQKEMELIIEKRHDEITLKEIYDRVSSEIELQTGENIYVFK